ncbi:MAG: sigma-70 family RNA polymerase sigma factor [Planctomycetaceae bacterium]|nr:sigma-70 family RNA polymerase sigma factor [Planctomycetales bacterium]MCB9923637.1 sigma-70 family RNA polymerase sigma factor [Planctomycetaceae bacterium]
MQATSQAVHPKPIRLRELVEQHYSAIYGYAYRLSGSVADAEDLTQQTFMIAHQKLHQVREEDKVIGWLYTIARTSFLKSRRRQRPSAATNYELNVEEIPEAFPRDSPFDEERLQAAINELDEDFKLCVTMFYYEELSYKEISDRLEIPIGTVMSRLARAKGRLRHAIASSATDKHNSPTAPKQQVATTQVQTQTSPFNSLK